MWREIVEESGETFATLTADVPGVLLTHLSWYNSGTRELLSAVQTEPLAALGITQVVVLLDDIYDVWTRLAQRDYLFDRQSSQADGRLISALDGVVDAEADVSRGLAENLRVLRNWRRTEMHFADTVAVNLGKPGLPLPVTPLGLKQGFATLRLALNQRTATAAYLSHPIKSLRTSNQANSHFERDATTLATWPPGLVDDTMQLHAALRAREIPLVCPTAIDELRFVEDPAGDVYLSRRWPDRALDEASTDYPYPPEQQDRTNFFLPPSAQPTQAARTAARETARGVRDAVFFDISSRDHYIVEHVPHLIVFRPFYDSSAWSSGVRSECEHWFDRRLLGRRAVFVHSRDDVRRRLSGIKDCWDKYSAGETDSAKVGEFAALRRALKVHLGTLLENAGCHNPYERELICDGEFEPPASTAQLPTASWLQHNHTAAENALRDAGLMALTWAFTRMKPEASIEPQEPVSPAGILLVDDTDQRPGVHDFNGLATRIAKALTEPDLSLIAKETAAFQAELVPVALEVFGSTGLNLFREVLAGKRCHATLQDSSEGFPAEVPADPAPKVLLYTCNEYERNAVLEVFKGSGRPSAEGYGLLWQAAKLESHEVIHLHGHQNPQEAATAVTAAIHSHNGVQAVVALGICGSARPESVHLYDVCVADSTWDGGWMSGETHLAEVHRRPLLLMPDSSTFSRFTAPEVQGPFLPTVKAGTFITTATKVKTPSERDGLAVECEQKGGSPIALDMEADAIASSCSRFGGGPIPFYCFKAVCDLADASEDADPATKASRQEVAALVAAQVAHTCLEHWMRQGAFTGGPGQVATT
ncbi:MAG: hypothetical protein LBE08_10010 [Bifidobacteriaceae bacterium]|nr:hypothetical protein [Bifidobacteriaceae bacterium]